MNRRGFFGGLCKGCKPCFAPQAGNTVVAQTLDSGERLVARIVKSKYPRNPWNRIGFEVLLHG